MSNILYDIVTMEKIIRNSNEISAFDNEKIEKFFADCIEESINALDSKDFDSLEWYEDCQLEDYYAEMEDLWSDEGEHLGNGFNMIWAKIHTMTRQAAPRKSEKHSII